jgi:hypothetical protein
VLKAYWVKYPLFIRILKIQACQPSPASVDYLVSMVFGQLLPLLAAIRAEPKTLF